MEVMKYSPTLLVVVRVVTLVATFRRTTFASGIADFDASVTVPVIVARSPCPKTRPGSKSTIRYPTRIRALVVILRRILSPTRGECTVVARQKYQARLNCLLPSLHI